MSSKNKVNYRKLKYYKSIVINKKKDRKKRLEALGNLCDELFIFDIVYAENVYHQNFKLKPLSERSNNAILNTLNIPEYDFMLVVESLVFMAYVCGFKISECIMLFILVNSLND